MRAAAYFGSLVEYERVHGDGDAHDPYVDRLASDVPPDRLPDFSDPCTVGGLLSLVREAWGIPGLSVRCRGGAGAGRGVGWWVWEDGPRANRPFNCVILGSPLDPFSAMGSSEAEALVAALEAAPCPQ